MLRTIVSAVLTFAVMSALAFFLKQQSPDFIEGAAVGTLGTLSLLLICHKLGVRVF